MKFYRSVGPEDILSRAAHAPAGVNIESDDDLEDWLRRTGQEPNPEGLFAITYVVDGQGFLRVADRGSEHVACAAGGPVLSAGEMFLAVTNEGLAVETISNQSTGYCPEPESWPAVAVVLGRIGIPHPGRFTQEIVFRRCPAGMDQGESGCIRGANAGVPFYLGVVVRPTENGPRVLITL